MFKLISKIILDLIDIIIHPISYAPIYTFIIILSIIYFIKRFEENLEKYESLLSDFNKRYSKKDEDKLEEYMNEAIKIKKIEELNE